MREGDRKRVEPSLLQLREACTCDHGASNRGAGLLCHGCHSRKE